MTDSYTPSPKRLRHLLDALAVGGDAEIITLEDWEDHLLARPHLRDSETVAWYLKTLAEEWLPLDPPSNLATDVTDHVETYLASQGDPPENRPLRVSLRMNLRTQ